MVEGARLENEVCERHQALRSTLTHTRSSTYRREAITRCVSVNLDVHRGSKPDLSQFYHNRFAHLARVRGYCWYPSRSSATAGSERTAIRFEVVDQPSGPGKDCMSQHSSGDDRLAHELELALRDPVQRQRLADYFAILQEWSLERQSAEPMSAQSPEVSNVSSGETARVSHPATVQPGTCRTASRANRQRTRRRS